MENIRIAMFVPLGAQAPDFTCRDKKVVYLSYKRALARTMIQKEFPVITIFYSGCAFIEHFLTRIPSLGLASFYASVKYDHPRPRYLFWFDHFSSVCNIPFLTRTVFAQC